MDFSMMVNCLLQQQKFFLLHFCDSMLTSLFFSSGDRGFQNLSPIYFTKIFIYLGRLHVDTSLLDP